MMKWRRSGVRPYPYVSSRITAVMKAGGSNLFNEFRFEFHRADAVDLAVDVMVTADQA
ncbi:MAG: hypothetical protein RL695_2235, partial [Pseudomonadota bacterium]